METISAPSFLTGSAGFGPAIKRWTVDEYHKMVDLGLIREGAPIELIDGLLVFKDRRDSGGSAMTQGARHTLAIAQLVLLSARLTVIGFHIRIQSAVAVSENHEPEPDGAVFQGQPARLQGRLPPADEVAVVIEVADSSLDYDRTVKLRTYATAGIPIYWIVNLRDNIVEVYERPDPLVAAYAIREDHFRDQEIEMKLPGTAPLRLRVSDIIAD